MTSLFIFFHPSRILMKSVERVGPHCLVYSLRAQTSHRTLLLLWQRTPSATERKPEHKDCPQTALGRTSTKSPTSSSAPLSSLTPIGTAGTWARRRILIYWCFFAPTVHSRLLLEGNGWNRCLTRQHLLITSLFKTSFTSTYSHGLPFSPGSWGHRETWGSGRSLNSCALQLGLHLLSVLAIYETAIIFSLWTKK